MLEIEIMRRVTAAGAGCSSKGNQMKWEQNGYWYKADAFGYESLAEVIVSDLLQFSNVSEYVVYEPVWIIYGEKRYRGCRSREFKSDQEELITLERLYRSLTGQSLAVHLARITETADRISYTADLILNYTGIENIGSYMTDMLGMDAFFLNEDRHTNNIALLYNGTEDTWRCCPFFDMGLSLFADTGQGYPFEKSPEECRNAVRAKPFSRDFDEQLDAAEALYGNYLKFDLTKAEMMGRIRELLTREDIVRAYSDQERERVTEVLRYQAGKYRYMMKRVSSAVTT